MPSTHTLAVGITMVLWAVIPILDKQGLSGEKVPPLVGMALRLLAAGAAFVPLLLWRADLRAGIAAASWRAIATFAASGIISMLLAQITYYHALAGGTVTRLFPVLFGGAPVLGLVLAATLLGEKITAQIVAGGALVAIGSAILLW